MDELAVWYRHNSLALHQISGHTGAGWGASRGLKYGHAFLHDAANYSTGGVEVSLLLLLLIILILFGGLGGGYAGWHHYYGPEYNIIYVIIVIVLVVFLLRGAL